VLPEFAEPTDRFIIEGRAGSGGMGDIFKGVDSTTGRQVALKVLRATASPHEKARFGREIAARALIAATGYHRRDEELARLDAAT
jgi:eukaryotic-like serine/threonine-protein kinase